MFPHHVLGISGRVPTELSPQEVSLLCESVQHPEASLGTGTGGTSVYWVAILCDHPLPSPFQPLGQFLAWAECCHCMHLVELIWKPLMSKAQVCRVTGTQWVPSAPSASCLSWWTSRHSIQGERFQPPLVFCSLQKNVDL